MKLIQAKDMHFAALNSRIREAGEDVVIENCAGQRFIGSGLAGIHITVNGTPGNALGAYLDGATIVVNGNAQDAVGDTMNAGIIVVKGNAGDAAGYAMRGGEIYIEGNAGYRAGIHMKEYQDKKPVMVIGGSAGSFLGEYQAGGVIVVLGGDGKTSAVGNFCGTGMHGGKIYLRGDCSDLILPEQVNMALAGEEDMAQIAPYVAQYCALFGADEAELTTSAFYVLTPNTKNPYKQMYVAN